jgi:hypothetical protein
MLGDRAAAEGALTEIETLLEPDWPPWLRTGITVCKAAFEFWVEQRPEEGRKLASSALQSHRRGDSLFGDLCEAILPACDLAADDFESALHRCDDLLGSSGSETEDAWLRVHVLVWRGAALLGLGKLEAAESSLRVAVPMFTHAFGPAIWVFCHIAVLLARQGRLREAAKTIAYIDHRLAEPDPEHLTPGQLRPYEETRAIVQREVDAEALDQLRREGSLLSAEEVIDMAFPPRAN